MRARSQSAAEKGEQSSRYNIAIVLTRTHRIVKEKDFNTVIGKGRFVTTPFFLLKYTHNNLAHSRYGFVVSKKVSKKATERNKAKRRLRAIVRTSPQITIKGYDVVFVVKKGIVTAQFNEIKSTTRDALEKALPSPRH